LANRLQAGIQAWTNALTGTIKEIDLSMDTDAPTQPTHKPGGDPQVYSQQGESGVFMIIVIPRLTNIIRSRITSVSRNTHTDGKDKLLEWPDR